jgi:Flp pilus assembly pilin Flp
MATDVNCDERAIAMRRPRGFWHDQGGLSSLEYAVLFVIVCVGALALWRTLGRSLVCQMTEADATFNATLGGGRNDTRPSYCRERNAAVSGSVPMSVGGPGASADLGSAPMPAPTSPKGSGSPAANHGSAAGSAGVRTSLGTDIDGIVNTHSPNLAKQVQALEQQGWKVRYSEPGETGSFTKRSTRHEVPEHLQPVQSWQDHACGRGGARRPHLRRGRAHEHQRAGVRRVLCQSL